MKKSKYLIIIIFLICNVILTSKIDFPLSNNQNIDNTEELSNSAIDCPYEYHWHQTWGNPSSQYARSIIIDGEGNIYALGVTRDPNDDIYLLKYNNEGVLQWEQRWGGSDSDWAHDLAFNSQGEIIVSGYTRSYGNGEKDLLLLCYDNQGVLQWTKFWGTAFSETSMSIIIDENDNIFLTGSIWSGSDHDLLLVKFDSIGNYIWHITWGGSDNSERGHDMSIDQFGNFYIAGYTMRNTNSLHQVLVIKFDQAGNYVWDTIYGVFPDDYMVRGMIIDDNYLYVTGAERFYNTNNFNTLLLKYDLNGVFQWNKTWDLSYWDIGYDLIFDSNEDIIITSICILPEKSYDMAFICYDKNGNFRWDNFWGGNERECPSKITMDDYGNLYIVGEIGTSHSDLCLLKYSKETIPPNIILINPSNNTILNSGREIVVNIIESNLDTVLYNWDNLEAKNWIEPFITELPVGNGIHYLHIFANDTFGFNDSKMFQFITDDENDHTPPEISLINPSNNSTHLSGTRIDIEVSDPILDTVMYKWDDDDYNVRSSGFSTSLPEGNGVHNLHIFANDTENNKASKVFQFTTYGDPSIFISDEIWGGEYTWTEAVDIGFCQGSGNESNPYIIEDKILDGGGLSSCLEISHSSEYFTIQNCQFFNSSYRDAVSFYDVENFQIIDCEFYQSYNGLLLEVCGNGLVSNSHFYDNYYSGIYCNETYQNVIRSNIIHDNDYGLILSLSSDSHIGDNTIYDCTDSGFYLGYSDYNLVLANYIHHTPIAFHSVYGDYNNISDNVIRYNDLGIYLQSSNNNWLMRNQFEGNNMDFQEEDSSGNYFDDVPDYPGPFPEPSPILPVFLISVGIVSFFAIIIVFMVNRLRHKNIVRDIVEETEIMRPSMVIQRKEIENRPPISSIKRNSIRCRACGEFTLLPANFCSECGYKIDDQIENVSTISNNYCGYCGTKIVSGARFCVECGESVNPLIK
jgi:parallel beta-helix repeat protein